MAAPARGKVLLVDDDPDSLKLASVRVTQAGYEVLPAGDGAAALAIAKSQHPDVILLDVVMPGMDGYQVLKLLKADAATADIPVVMLTSKASDKDMATSLGLGSMRHMVKPPNPKELAEEIALAVERHRFHHKPAA